MTSKRLHVVSVCRSLPTPQHPSAGVFVFNRLAALADLADVRVIQPVPYMPGVRPLPAWALQPRRVGPLEIVPAPMLYVPGALKSLDGFWLARAILPFVRRLRTERAIDLLDAHFGYPDGAGCARVARALGLPYFVTLRGLEIERAELPRIGREMFDALRDAAGCIAVGRTLQALAVAHGVPPERVRVIHNAIDSRVFHPGDRAAARERLGVGASEPLLVGVGHLIERKRHHVLVEAFARLRGEFAGLRLAIVGGGTDEPDYHVRLSRQIAELGLGDAVRLAGNLPQAHVVDWLRAADAFCLVSAREGCCNAVLEALAVGTPTVTTDVGDNAAFVRPPLNGVIVPVDDAAATAAALADVLRRRDWDRGAIAADLRAGVGDWRAVAARVAEYFEERLLATRTGRVEVA